MIFFLGGGWRGGAPAPLFALPRSCLSVESQHVVHGKVEGLDRSFEFKSGVRSVPVVTVEPGLEMLLAVRRVLVDGGVGPLAQAGLDEALGFAVGARGVGPGEDVFDTQLVEEGRDGP